MSKTTKNLLHKYTEKLLKLKETVVNSFLVIGGLLYEVKRDGIYKEQYQTFEEYIGDPEISMSRPVAYKVMKVYQVFVDKYDRQKEVEGIDCDKLYCITRVVDDKNIDDWIEKARVSSRSDLIYEVRKKKGLPVHDPAKHLSENIAEFFDECFADRQDNKKFHDTVVEVITKWEEWRKG